MTSVTARSTLAIALIALISLAAAAPAFGSCGSRKSHRATAPPPCSNDNVWDTQYRRCLSFRPGGPSDKQQRDSDWILSGHEDDYSPFAGWN